METKFKEKFMALWTRYLDGAPLPIVFFYTDREGAAPKVKPPTEHRCIMADISRVRNGKSISFDVESIGCFGGKRYLGYTQDLRPGFEYFLSCGIPGEMEGERYKKSPALVKEIMRTAPKLKAPSRFIVFKRWDKVEEGEMPDVVIFFATPDVISGLFTLANFDVADLNGAICPFGSGCSTIVLYPYLEKASANPRGVIGMFDASARPFVPANLFTFAAPFKKFSTMVENMEESFFITGSWGKVKRRIVKDMKG